MKKLLERKDVDQKYTWNVYTLFKDDKEYEDTFHQLMSNIKTYEATYKGKLSNAQTINDAIDALKPISVAFSHLGAYVSLQQAVDSRNYENQMRSSQAEIYFQEASERLTFIENELNMIPLEVLKKAQQQNPENHVYLQEFIDNRPHILHPEVVNALTSLGPVLELPYSNYNSFKFVDLKFNPFVVDGVEYPLSFTAFENEYEYDPNTKVRRAAYEAFYNKLKEYNFGFGNNYIGKLQYDKAMADLAGYSSVFDYLLRNQKVDVSMMDRQIDVIMEKLAPAMRKYAKLLQRVHKLDKMTYADLKIAVDPTFEPKVTIEESKEMLLDGLKVMGPEYLELVRQSYDDRWIDFPQNLGKSTGGFCSTPYQKNSFILVNWNGQMDEVMVIAHELGHAGHFYYANKFQNILNTRPSLYFIEAPSTTNEIIMARELIKKADSKRLKTWIQSVMVSRTYYHNCVTHLLEAAFQREVYRLMDQRQPLSAFTLNELKLKVLRQFWGDDVEIPEWAGMTWMRQPHYFMGLYPYTYSAGLTLGTVVSKRIFEGTLDPKAWIEVLKAGGTKSPLDLAKMVDVDLSTEKPLLEMIEFISQTIDEIIENT